MSRCPHDYLPRFGAVRPWLIVRILRREFSADRFLPFVKSLLKFGGFVGAVGTQVLSFSDVVCEVVELDVVVLKKFD